MNRLYVLIDAQYPVDYRAVQGAHAVAAHVLTFPNKWKNETLVFLKTDEIHSWHNMFLKAKRDFAAFHEPDVNNKLTALAIVDDGKIFRHLELS